jgi:hypothetical protein
MADIDYEFVYDLIAEVRKNPARKHAVVEAVRRIDILRRQEMDGKATREDIADAQAKLIPACGFNFGLLIPEVFPRYPFDTPLDFSARPFMFAMTSMTPNSVITFRSGRQVGKCADEDTEVITDKGPRTLGSIFEAGIVVKVNA